jgi:hypothetical protein
MSDGLDHLRSKKSKQQQFKINEKREENKIVVKKIISNRYQT